MVDLSEGLKAYIVDQRVIFIPVTAIKAHETKFGEFTQDLAEFLTHNFYTNVKDSQDSDDTVTQNITKAIYDGLNTSPNN